MQGRPFRAVLGLTSLALFVASWLLSAASAQAASDQALPIKICLKQPKVNGQHIIQCPRPASTVPKSSDFYLLVVVADPNGFQTSALDWEVQRWQPRKHRWATVRSQWEAQIQMSWQYVWLLQHGLSAGRYRALVWSDYLATPVGAPMFHFAAAFTVH